MTRFSTLMASLLISLVAAPGALAGNPTATSLVTDSQMDGAIARHLSADEASRTAIRTLVQREDVRAMAVASGLDLVRAEAAITALDGEELATLGAAAADANAALVGGDLEARHIVIGLAIIGAITVLAIVL